jgi:polysaccharide biosynthesis/export protein
MVLSCGRRAAIFRLSACVLALFLLTGNALLTAQDARPAGSQGFPDLSQPTAQSDTSNPTPIAKPSNETQPSAVPDSSPAGMLLGQGDLLEMNVYGIPELSQRARVSNTGDVYLPLIDRVHVAGITVEEAQTTIEKLLSDGGFVRNPHVTILVTESSSALVSVLGEVAKPGVYPVIGPRRLYDVISAAGGLTEKAGKNVSIAHRNEPDSPKTITLSDKLKQDSQSNVLIQPGDTLVVERAGAFFVVGDVVHPSGFIMDAENLTVLKAMALAGGPTRSASLNKAFLIRRTADGVKQTQVPLKKIMKSESPDVAMQVEDILFVPSSSGKFIAGRALQTAFQLAGSASIVAIPR